MRAAATPVDVTSCSKSPFESWAARVSAKLFSASLTRVSVISLTEAISSGVSLTTVVVGGVGVGSGSIS